MNALHAVRPAERCAVVLRDVVVTAREQVSENMLRITLGGNDLAPAVHDSPGAWVKLFVPRPDGEGEHGRAFTVRGFDPISDELDIDVFLHDGSTMTRWARGCRIGESARIGGPRPSGASSSTASSLLLFGDETALPALSAILEREYGGRPIRAVVEIGDERDRQEVSVPDGARLEWLTRGVLDAPGSILVSAAAHAEIPSDAGVWFAAEAGAAQLFRRMLKAQDVAELHVQGYWRKGQGDYRE